jgi:hypothetical protein
VGGLNRTSSRTHGRRDTNAYPPTPNTTGIITNIPNTVLIIDFSIPLVSVALWRRLLVELLRYAAIQSSITTLAGAHRRHHRPPGDL